MFVRVALCVYATLVFGVLGVRPLWADELLQISGARTGNFVSVIHWAQVLPGGAPFPLVLQNLAILSFGWSNWVIRLPAALFGIGSAIVFAKIARGDKVALGLFLAMPILFRYSTEGRMYSQAVFFVLLAWAVGPRRLRMVAATAALYSSPFAIFPLLAIDPLAAAVAGAFFLPWWLVQRGVQAVQGSLSVYSFHWSQLSPLLALREFTGGGYWCGVPLVLLAMMGRSREPGMIGLSVLGPPVADAIAGYFFAARQWLFALPPLILSAAPARGWPACVLLCIFFVAALAKDVRQTFFASENWGLAAQEIRRELGTEGCLTVTPAAQISYYSFYEPSLAARACEGEPSGLVVVAASPYTTAAEEQLALASLKVQSRRVVGTMRITSGIYSR